MSLALPARPEWHDNAACRDLGPAKFFTVRGDNTAVTRAKAICAGCPVRAECLDLALVNHERFGVFGGLTPKERLAEARRRGIQIPTGGPPTAECGTPGGYSRHRRTLHEPACPECLAAHATAKAARKNGGTMPDKPAVVNMRRTIGPAARWAIGA